MLYIRKYSKSSYLSRILKRCGKNIKILRYETNFSRLPTTSIAQAAERWSLNIVEINIVDGPRFNITIKSWAIHDSDLNRYWGNIVPITSFLVGICCYAVYHHHSIYVGTFMCIRTEMQVFCLVQGRMRKSKSVRTHLYCSLVAGVSSVLQSTSR